MGIKRAITAAIVIATVPACERINIFLPTRNEKPVASFVIANRDPEKAAIERDKPGRFVVHFDASASRDDSDIKQFRWDFGDGTTVIRDKETGEKMDHEYFVANGSFTITLRVMDNDEELSEPVSRRVELTRNHPPIAAFVARPDPLHPRLVTFDASGSTDPDEADRAFLKYLWDFGNPPGQFTQAMTNSTTQHVYPLLTRPETYLVTLRVVDSASEEGTFRMFVAVPTPAVLAGGLR